jgi:hypothetical protein
MRHTSSIWLPFPAYRFLAAEHQCLLRRLVTWQVYEGLPLTRGARRPHGAKRCVPTVLLSRILFPIANSFPAKKMNSDGIVFGGERMGHSFYLLLGLLFCFVELRIEKKMNLLV